MVLLTLRRGLQTIVTRFPYRGDSRKRFPLLLRGELIGRRSGFGRESHLYWRRLRRRPDVLVHVSAAEPPGNVSGDTKRWSSPSLRVFCRGPRYWDHRTPDKEGSVFVDDRPQSFRKKSEVVIFHKMRVYWTTVGGLEDLEKKKIYLGRGTSSTPLRF